MKARCRDAEMVETIFVNEHGALAVEIPNVAFGNIYSKCHNFESFYSLNRGKMHFVLLLNAELCD